MQHGTASPFQPILRPLIEKFKVFSESNMWGCAFTLNARQFLFDMCTMRTFSMILWLLQFIYSSLVIFSYCRQNVTDWLQMQTEQQNPIGGQGGGGWIWAMRIEDSSLYFRCSSNLRKGMHEAITIPCN